MYRQTKQAPEIVAAKRGHVEMQRKMFYLVLIQVSFFCAITDDFTIISRL